MVSLSHVVTLNKSVKTAADALSNFSGSINRNVLPQIRQLAKYGIRPTKAAPDQLARLNVSEPMDDVIEADVEDVTLQLPGLSEKTGLTEK